MIWNDAVTVIYNGTPVQSVICNGIKIWPRVRSTPLYSRVTTATASVSSSLNNTSGV